MGGRLQVAGRPRGRRTTYAAAASTLHLLQGCKAVWLQGCVAVWLQAPLLLLQLCGWVAAPITAAASLPLELERGIQILRCCSCNEACVGAPSLPPAAAADAAAFPAADTAAASAWLQPLLLLRCSLSF